MISCMVIKRASHSRIRFSNGLMYGLDRIACVLTMWSSKSDWISSSDRKMKVPESR